MTPYKKTLLVGCITVLVFVVIVSIKIVLIIQDNKLILPSNFDLINPLSMTSSFLSGNKISTEGAKSVNQSTGPIITAQAYLIGNITTGEIYGELNSTRVMPVASVSKLITALVALDEYRPDMKITITPEETNVPPDASQLNAGETLTMKELLYPLLLNSSNVAAEAIASSTDRSRFLELMSSYAWEIGMPSSFFADPSGLDPRNHASAKDIFALAQYLTKFRPDIAAITKISQISVATTTDHGSHVFTSIHPFVNDPNFLGGKTGRTTIAGETMLTMINIKGQAIAIVILGSNIGAREKDTRLLISKVSDLI